ncbi:MAG: sugar transferase [Flavobacterium sp.]|uniref:sugar transferase n=1 Tax=Flavobacterium TaxID=237 RepID=UPI000DB721A3|nr:sugar transferase [Flavobacterium sp.]MCZ8091044.1 sugar transferase [Flavobacterium sp.]MCZ8330786.1 sugar transferase [Flavobacterium sp.]PZO27615.1 MAG: sugar transferase [Flavobacteriaceae bacterium]
MIKRLFDIFFSSFILITFSWLILVSYIITSIQTKSNGIFVQQRIGQYGKSFSVLKLKSMYPKKEKVTSFGQIIRRYKIDELPQFLNVLFGQMSIVGPRPDIAGYYDLLEGEERKLLELKPGITSEASIKYKDEEYILSQHENPKLYNDTVIFPDKIKMNLDYYYKQSFILDVKIILKTIKNLIS